MQSTKQRQHKPIAALVVMALGWALLGSAAQAQTSNPRTGPLTLQALFEQLGLCRRDDGPHRAVEALYDGRRSLGRAEQANPAAGIHAAQLGQARFGQGRHVRQGGRALQGRDGEAFRLTRLDAGQRAGGAVEQELDAAGELGDWEYDLDTYSHCITVLKRYFTGNSSGLTERDARIYSHYLQTEHKGFVKLAEELAAGR